MTRQSHTIVKRQTLVEEQVTFFGTTLTYECGLAREFQDSFTKKLYSKRNLTCQWDKTWTPENRIDKCVWVACINPPSPPTASRLVSTWDGSPINFTYNSSYECNTENEVKLFFDFDKGEKLFNITCLPGGTWSIPTVWPKCYSSINCSQPPEVSPGGTWEWKGSYAYKTEILYTCGPYGMFQMAGGRLESELVSTCSWNRSWTPAVLPPCQATSCAIIPIPPPHTNMVFIPDSKSSFSLVSNYTKYSPSLPYTLPFPGPEFCNGASILMIIGKVTSSRRRQSGDIIFWTENREEAYHVSISLADQSIFRTASNRSGYPLVTYGAPDDGNSIDIDEPFVIRISCDDDGFVLKVNKDEPYMTFLHVFPIEEIKQVEFSNKLDLSFVGFGDTNMNPAPPINFNVTFGCRSGEVFESDWLATPRVRMTCSDNGAFTEPEDWDNYICVIPTTTECYDCTTSTTTSTTTAEPVTLPANEMLYPSTADYHWEQFDLNTTKAGQMGGWKKPAGLAQGALGFGKAIQLTDKQCLYDTNFMMDIDGAGHDPCIINPNNCTDGISFSAWDNLMYSESIVAGTDSNVKQYVISTGGDFNSIQGKAWPGFAIYHEGRDIVGLVSTGEKLWVLSVSGQLYNNTWTQIGIRFSIPNLNNPNLAQTEQGRENMGGLKMYINGEEVGHSLLPELTDRGSSVWIPQPRLTDDGTPTGNPVMMLGCHQNSNMKLTNTYTGYAGTKSSPALIDEVAIWRHRLKPFEIPFLLGGYESDFGSINPSQFGAMLGNVDLSDPEQAAAAQAVLQAMLMGPPTTLAPFPTRTALPTTLPPTTNVDPLIPTTTTTTTKKPVMDEKQLMNAIIARQNILSSMLGTSSVTQGQDPEEVEARFSMAIVASAILSGTQDNINKWGAVETDELNEHEGAFKTARQMENYMLAWVGSVNISAERPNNPNWKTNYFNPNDNSMRYATAAEDMVLAVDKFPIEELRGDGAVRVSYPDYSGWQWAEAKAKWKNVKDNFTVPTGMFLQNPGCDQFPLTILTGVYNGLPKVAAHRRNPINIHSRVFRVDSKVISVRASINADPMDGDVEETFKCPLDQGYMDSNPIKISFWHNVPEKAKRSLVWHTEEFWEGIEVRHCVWWNENFGTNGAWDDTPCKITYTDNDQSSCECSMFGSYAVLAELLEEPSNSDKALWVLLIKWIGIVLGTILLTIFIAIVFLSVVVGEMFHQIRMWCCLSYMVGNILVILADFGLCDGRHNNIALSICIMFFFQASLWWNMCEAHATFKGITAGIINGRTKIYHPIAWGMPLICIGFLCYVFGDDIGTNPNCFISWNKDPIAVFFLYNSLCFILAVIFNIIIIFNVMRVQSHNRDTINYLKDQVKGLILTTVLMIVLWSYGTIGSFANLKTPDMDVMDLMPMFQILSGWFGVILFLTLGMMSKRFRIGLTSQANEKKKKLEAMKNKYQGGVAEPSLETAETTPNNSRPASALSTRPVSPVEIEDGLGSRPMSAASATASRPTSATSATGSRPATASGSRPASGTGSRPASGAGSRPASGAGSRPASGAGSRPASGAGSRPASGAGSRPASRPASAAPSEAPVDENVEE